MKMILFDIDGTLLLTGGAGRIALESCFEELFGIPNSWGDLIPDGKTDDMILRELAQNALSRDLTKHEYDTLRKRYLELFRIEIKKAPHFRLMPHIKEVLLRLSQKKNVLMGLATGNFEEASWLKVERGGLKSYFKFGGFGSDSSDRIELTRTAIERGQKLASKPISKNDIFVIGDSIHDIRAGKALGIHTLAVATGRTTHQELLDCKPDLLLKDLTEKEKLEGYLFKR